MCFNKRISHRYYTKNFYNIFNSCLGNDDILLYAECPIPYLSISLNLLVEAHLGEVEIFLNGLPIICISEISKVKFPISSIMAWHVLVTVNKHINILFLVPS